MFDTFTPAMFANVVEWLAIGLEGAASHPTINWYMLYRSCR